MRILESTIEFVAFSALLLETMTGHMASCFVWPCHPKVTTISLVDRSFKLVAKNGSENTVFSPFNFFLILEAIDLSIHGKGQSQIQKAMKCAYRLVRPWSMVEAGHRPIQRNNESERHVREASERYRVEDAELTVASAIFRANRFVSNDLYKETMNSTYRVSQESVDFTRPVDASTEMNRWIRHETHDLVKNLVHPGDIDRDTTAVIAGTVYLKDFWVNPFDSDKTEMRPFHVNGGFSRNVSTMTTTAQFNYGELPNINAKFVELPYETNYQYTPLSMFVIVPDSVDGIGELIRNIKEITFSQLNVGKIRNIELTLPKFKIESTIDLKELAENLGITDVFKVGANFSKITSVPGFSISKVVQKIVIAVDETGMNVAGGTGGFGNTSSAGKPILFNVDRPFIGIVADNVFIPWLTVVVADPRATKSSR